jgi:hypothetical protein
MSVVTAKLNKGLDWERLIVKLQGMDPELFRSDQELVDIVIVVRAVESQFAERMILVVAAQIGNATTKRFDDAAIIFRR